MAQYTLTFYKNNVLEQTIPNLSLRDAFLIAQPADKRRWHLLTYPPLVERIQLLATSQTLLIGWEEAAAGFDSYQIYIERSIKCQAPALKIRYLDSNALGSPPLQSEGCATSR